MPPAWEPEGGKVIRVSFEVAEKTEKFAEAKKVAQRVKRWLPMGKTQAMA